MKRKLLSWGILLMLPVLFANCESDNHPTTPSRESVFFIDYRSVEGKADGMAVIELDPESLDFGKIKNKLEMGVGVLPHHIYYDNSAKKLYTTALGGSFLYQITTAVDDDGYPLLVSATPINTGSNTVGENIFFTTDNRYFVTFMGGDGSLKGGSVGVFNATTNQLIHTISGSIEDDPTKYIMYPHGISVNESRNLMMVTSTIHPDLTSGVGNSTTLIDLTTYDLIKTYTVADSPTVMSAPVEVLLLRGEFPQYALATTMLGGDIWIAPYNETTHRYDEFSKIFDGASHGLGWTLEMYIDNTKKLYVSFADPGKVLVFDISNLPNLNLVKTLNADKGAHHMSFFKTKSGKSVVAVQNNLLDIPGINSGTINVIELSTGAVLGTVDLRAQYGIIAESIESTRGPGSYMHH